MHTTTTTLCLRAARRETNAAGGECLCVEGKAETNNELYRGKLAL